MKQFFEEFSRMWEPCYISVIDTYFENLCCAFVPLKLEIILPYLQDSEVRVCHVGRRRSCDHGNSLTVTRYQISLPIYIYPVSATLYILY